MQQLTLESLGGDCCKQKRLPFEDRFLGALFQLISIKLSILLSSGPREPENNTFFYSILPTLHSHFACRRLQSVPLQNLLEVGKQSCTQEKSFFYFYQLRCRSAGYLLRDAPVGLQEPVGLVLTPLCRTALLQTFTFLYATSWCARPMLTRLPLSVL